VTDASGNVLSETVSDWVEEDAEELMIDPETDNAMLKQRFFEKRR